MRGHAHLVASYIAGNSPFHRMALWRKAVLLLAVAVLCLASPAISVTLGVIITTAVLIAAIAAHEIALPGRIQRRGAHSSNRVVLQRAGFDTRRPHRIRHRPGIPDQSAICTLPRHVQRRIVLHQRFSCLSPQMRVRLVCPCLVIGSAHFFDGCARVTG